MRRSEPRPARASRSRSTCSRGTMTHHLCRPLGDRIREKIRIDPCGCHIWTGTTSNNSKDSYGRNNPRPMVWLEGKKVQAHRAAYFVEHGVWPSGMLRHRCDNPLCINVAHLIDGTHDENMDDMVSRERQQRGEARHNARLTADDVFDIRWLRAMGATYRGIAASFSVSFITIFDVCAGKTWRHV